MLAEAEGSKDRTELKAQLTILNQAGKAATLLFKRRSKIPEVSESTLRWASGELPSLREDLTTEDVEKLNNELRSLQEAMLSAPRKSPEKKLLKER